MRQTVLSVYWQLLMHRTPVRGGLVSVTPKLAEQATASSQAGSPSHGDHQANLLATRSRLPMSAPVKRSLGPYVDGREDSSGLKPAQHQATRVRTTGHTDTHLGFSSGNDSGSPKSPGHHSWIPTPAAQRSCAHLIRTQGLF